ncbi:alpha-ketoglutarate-dependent dioxygenase alkB homolog 4 isoform X2 [Periplaneta americana]|uniref:alpha-ketoglutarate-dependent dioxygenase alkB homolog 4 isoform X2 n=1 Tax=Periplaneta americana TaxID=6978 RepID=UPI0037E88FF2
MDTTRPCGCKGIRTCLICEQEFGIIRKDYLPDQNDRNSYVYCPWCNKAWSGWDVNLYKDHPNHNGTSVNFSGIFIQLDFLSCAEEDRLMKGIDEMSWAPSQSGRRKQNFGPKCNFKKKRLKLGDFNGFPAFTKFVQEKFRDVEILHDYQTIEQCSLEYNPTRGASIDPHIDDCWVWGERIITVNLLSDCVLTLTPYQGDSGRYNLQDIKTYPAVLNQDGKVISKNGTACVNNHISLENSPHDSDIVVRVPMPRRSLLVMYGSARYVWEHCVLRQDVTERRVCLAYREFTPPYLEGGTHESEGNVILDIARNFWSHEGNSVIAQEV